MGNPTVDQWKLEGCLYVWHYPQPVKNLPGWHLNADPTACESISNLLTGMLAAEWSSRKRIPVSIPARMLVGPGHHWEPVPVLQIRYPKNEVSGDCWQMEQSESAVLTLTVGENKLAELRESLLGLPDWKDDFALGPTVDSKRRNNRDERVRFESECLWFWTKIE